MKRNTFLVLLLAMTTLIFAQSYQQTTTGLKTNLQSMNVEIEFLSPEIVRVLKAPEGSVYDKKSLSVVKTAEQTALKISKNGEVVTLTSSALNVDIDLLTGKIGYRDAQGQTLFTEKDYGTQFTGWS